MGSLRLILCTIVTILDRKFPRLGRKSFIYFSLGCWILSFGGILIVTALGLLESLSWIPRVCSICALGICSIYNIMAELLSVELFPTVLRNMGNALTSSSSRIMAILAPNVLLIAEVWNLAPWVVILGLIVCWRVCSASSSYQRQRGNHCPTFMRMVQRFLIFVKMVQWRWTKVTDFGNCGS